MKPIEDPQVTRLIDRLPEHYYKLTYGDDDTKAIISKLIKHGVLAKRVSTGEVYIKDSSRLNVPYQNRKKKPVYTANQVLHYITQNPGVAHWELKRDLGKSLKTLRNLGELSDNNLITIDYDNDPVRYYPKTPSVLPPSQDYVYNTILKAPKHRLHYLKAHKKFTGPHLKALTLLIKMGAIAKDTNYYFIPGTQT